MLTVSLVARSNADSKVELVVGANPQLALAKEVSGTKMALQAHIRWRYVDFFHNPTVGGKLANKES